MAVYLYAEHLMSPEVTRRGVQGRLNEPAETVYEVRYRDAHLGSDVVLVGTYNQLLQLAGRASQVVALAKVMPPPLSESALRDIERGDG